VKRGRRTALAGRVVTLAALVLIGLLWARLLLVQPRADVGGAPNDPRRAQLAQRKLTEISGALDRLSAAAHKGQTGATTVQFSTAEINALLTDDPEVSGALEDARISSPEVRLQNGRVITTAMVERGSVGVPIAAEGELAARGGMLLYASDRVRVAGVPATGAIRDTIDSRLQEAFRHLERRTHARVDRATVGRDRITLYLSRREER
jgi:hypothetical protein